jgi:hypothetical protein
VLRHLYSARGYAELVSGLARLLAGHRRWRAAIEVGLALAVAVPVALGAAGIHHPLMLYSSGAGLVGLVALEAVASL